MSKLICKRGLSLLLTLCMVLAMLPVLSIPAHAEGETTIEVDSEQDWLDAVLAMREITDVDLYIKFTGNVSYTGGYDETYGDGHDYRKALFLLSFGRTVVIDLNGYTFTIDYNATEDWEGPAAKKGQCSWYAFWIHNLDGGNSVTFTDTSAKKDGGINFTLRGDLLLYQNAMFCAQVYNSPTSAMPCRLNFEAGNYHFVQDYTHGKELKDIRGVRSLFNISSSYPHDTYISGGTYRISSTSTKGYRDEMQNLVEIDTLNRDGRLIITGGSFYSGAKGGTIPTTPEIIFPSSRHKRQINLYGGTYDRMPAFLTFTLADRLPDGVDARVTYEGTVYTAAQTTGRMAHEASKIEIIFAQLETPPTLAVSGDLNVGETVTYTVDHEKLAGYDYFYRFAATGKTGSETDANTLNQSFDAAGSKMVSGAVWQYMGDRENAQMVGWASATFTILEQPLSDLDIASLSPGTAELNVGDGKTLQYRIRGGNELKYSVSTDNGANYGAATSAADGSIISVPIDASASGEYEYVVKATDSRGGTKTSTPITVKVFPAGIVTPEGSIDGKNGALGAPLTLTCNLTNKGTLLVENITYQWYDETGAPIDGETGQTYTVTKSAPTAICYICEVTYTKDGMSKNAYIPGTAIWESSGAKAPDIDWNSDPNGAELQLQGTQTSVYAEVTLDSVVMPQKSGTISIAGYWTVNGNVYDGPIDITNSAGTSKTYTFDSDDLGFRLDGSVKVAKIGFFAITTETAGAGVYTAKKVVDDADIDLIPSIPELAESDDVVCYVDGAATIYVTASTPEQSNYEYQWYTASDNQPIPGKTSATLVAPTSVVGSTDYYCKVKGGWDLMSSVEVKSDDITVEVKAIPVAASPCGVHTWGSWEHIAGTDMHARMCTVCDASETDTCDWVIEATSAAAVCTADGHDDYKCSVCAGTKSEVVPHLGHDYTGTYTHTAADHSLVCPTCSDTLIDKAPHSWDGGTVTKAATPTEAGIVTYACTLCDETKTEVIPAATIIIDTISLKVPVPAYSNTPATWDKVTGEAGYTVASVTWTPDDSKFAAETIYTVDIFLEAKPGYMFASPTASVNSESASVYTSSADEASVGFEFPATGKKPATPPGSSGGGGATMYALTFETNGGTEIVKVSKASGTTVSLADYKPKREGFDFAGWYSDKELTKPVSSVKLTENITVYAGWVKHVSDDGMPFTDVKKSDWFFDDVKFVWEKDLMKGTATTLFSPYMDTSRAMIVTILWRLEGEPAVSGNGGFTDVPAGTWYTSAVAWAQQNGIVKGYSDELFGPDDPITREQLALIMMNYTRYTGGDVSARADLSEFSDEDQISSWAQEAMAWANDTGLINGKGSGILDPRGKATRAEAAAILHRYMR